MTNTCDLRNSNIDSCVFTTGLFIRPVRPHLSPRPSVWWGPVTGLSLGDFEVFLATTGVTLLGVIVYNVITSFSLRDLLKRFGFLKVARRDFYECGFRPLTQKTIRLPIQFLLICIFFLLYDIELVFLFPYVSGLAFGGLFDAALILFFFGIFFCSLLFDFNRHALL